MEVKAMEALKLYRGASPVFRTLFNDFWGDQRYQPVNNHHSIPLLNIKETNNEYEISLAAPGFAKEDFKVIVENDVLTISSEKKEEKVESTEKGVYSRKEFWYQNFSRSLTLPQGEVDTQAIFAKYDNGILTVSLPKKEEAKPQSAKLIAIN
jgi:HSP20 family protein